MSSLVRKASDDVTQESNGAVEQNSARPGHTWHQMLLHPSPSSSQLSSFSEMPTDAGSQPSTPRQTRLGIFGEQDESATNYDSGNFSLSEPGGKEKVIPASGGTSGDLHQRFVQLNTELYQAKTELLTYKYKWNEIRNEIELSWSKKIDKLTDDKNDLLLELEDVRKEIARLKEQPIDPNGRELLRIRSELHDMTVRFECKQKANGYLKQTIAEQHVEKENLSLRVRNLEKQGCEEHSDMCRVKASERWFREELHRCQNANAKLKVSYATLDNLLCKERTERAVLIEAVQHKHQLAVDQNNKLFSILQTHNATNEQAKEKEGRSTEQFEQQTTLLKDAENRRVYALLENYESLEKQNLDLHAVIGQLRQALEDRQTQAETVAEKLKEAYQEISRLREETTANETASRTIRRYRTEIESLSAQLARECFNKRQIDVSVEKLKAQVKVLSINLATRTCQLSAAEEFELETVRQCNRALQDQCNLLVNEKQRLESALIMCSERSKEHYEQLLLENFRSIQSKNLDLELKLGQCVASGNYQNADGELQNDEMVRASEETIRKLRKDIGDLEQMVIQQQSEGKEKYKTGKKSSSKSRCLKHGSFCHQNVSHSTVAEDEDDEMRNLRITVKAIESENRRRLQRYEINNRTLLRKVREHVHERNRANARVEELEREHEKCAKLRCEMASARERCILLEADLETAQQVANTLRGEKDRLVDLLQNNCLLMADGDIWGSLRRAFKELRDLQQIHKENGRLRHQLERDAEKIEQLQVSVGDWKLAADVQTSEADELRSELTVKRLQLEDSKRAIDQLVGENSSLQQSVSVAGEHEKGLREKLNKLNQLVQIQEIRLETAHERLKLYDASERILAASKDKFFDDLHSLEDAILVEKQEKYELEEEVRELRQNMVNAVGNSLQNFHQTINSNGGSGLHSTTITSPEPQSLPFSPTSLDIDHLKALLEESSRKRYSLQPLHECVSSLKLEMDHLNSVLQIGDYPVQQQQQRQQPRVLLSLMDELNDATNGHYGSR